MAVNDVKGARELTATATFRLGVLGSVATARFTDRVAALDLKPKHVGLLTALAQGADLSQQELASQLGVAPSLVVALADHLEGLGAVSRQRDRADRRRQVLTLTDHGRALLAECAATATELDADLLADLTPAQRAALADTLAALARALNLPA